MRGGEVFVEASVCTESKLQRGPSRSPRESLPGVIGGDVGVRWSLVSP